MASESMEDGSNPQIHQSPGSTPRARVHRRIFESAGRLGLLIESARRLGLLIESARRLPSIEVPPLPKSSKEQSKLDVEEHLALLDSAEYLYALVSLNEIVLEEQKKNGLLVKLTLTVAVLGVLIAILGIVLGIIF